MQGRRGLYSLLLGATLLTFLPFVLPSSERLMTTSGSASSHRPLRRSQLVAHCALRTRSLTMQLAVLLILWATTTNRRMWSGLGSLFHGTHLTTPSVIRITVTN